MIDLTHVYYRLLNSIDQGFQPIKSKRNMTRVNLPIIMILIFFSFSLFLLSVTSSTFDRDIETCIHLLKKFKLRSDITGYSSRISERPLNSRKRKDYTLKSRNPFGDFTIENRKKDKPKMRNLPKRPDGIPPTQSREGKRKSMNSSKKPTKASNENFKSNPRRLRKVTFKSKPVSLIEQVTPVQTKQEYEMSMDRLLDFLEFGFEHPDFQKESFIDEIYLILTSTDKDKLPKSRMLFWYNLTRLVFKWMIHMREKTAIREDFKFERASKSIKRLCLIISDQIDSNIPSDFNLKAMNLSTFNSFKDLLTFELFENSHISDLSLAAFNFFYNNNDNEMENEDNKIKCERLRKISFTNNFNANILLKYWFVFFESWEEIKECIMDQSDYSEHLKSLSSSSSIEGSQIDGQSKKVLSLQDLKIDNLKYTSTDTVNFFLDNDRQFLIPESDYTDIFLVILRSLEELAPLSVETLEKVIEFKSSDGSIKWDEAKAKRFLKETLLVSKEITIDERERYSKKFESFIGLESTMTTKTNVIDTEMPLR